METEEHTIGEAELIHLLAVIVSKNGNLLLNAGPLADGTIPQLQASRLRALGAWLGTNGEAIYGTRPWERPTGQTDDGISVRFTAKDDALYAILLGQPKTESVSLELGVQAAGAEVSLLGSSGNAEASYANGKLNVTFDGPLLESHAHALRVRLG